MKLRLRWNKPNIGETEVRVYRSGSPMDPQALPAPLATLAAGSKEYIDSTVVNQNTYYYRVGVVVNGVEQVSSEQLVFAEENLALATGVWFSAVAATGDKQLVNYNPAATTNYRWDYFFGLTDLFKVSRYAYSSSSSANMSTFSGTINQFSTSYVFNIQAKAKDYSSGNADFDLELKDVDDNVIAALRCKRDVSYGVSLYYGRSLSALVKAPVTGSSYTEVLGLLKFEPSGFEYEMDPELPSKSTEQVESFFYEVDLTSVTKMVFTNCRAYVSSSNGNALALLELVGQQVFVNFDTSLDTLNGEVDLTWQEIVPTAVDQVVLYRDTNPIDTALLPAPLTTVAAGLESYSDAVPDPSANYHYLIDVQQGGESNYSLSVEALFNPLAYGIGIHYKMENTTGGVILDETANSYDATLYGTYSLVTGIDGQALEFSSQGAHADTGLASAFGSLFATAGVEWGVAAWFKAGPQGGTSVDGVIVGRGGGTGTGSTFQIFIPASGGSSASGRTPGQLCFDIRGSYTDTNIPVDDNEWHVAVVTWDGAQGVCRVDDSEFVMNAGSATLQDADTLAIGCHTGQSRPTAITAAHTLIGAVDQVRLFNRSLSYRDRAILANEFNRFYDFLPFFNFDTDEVTISWKEIDSSEVVEVVIYRDTSPIVTTALPTALATVAAGVESYLDTSAALDSEYYYLIDVKTTGPVSHYSKSVYVSTANSLLQFEPKGPMLWYDPSDLSTLFQDTAGTVPVTADGDPIKHIKDKSSNGYDATWQSGTLTYRTDGTLHWFEGADSRFTLTQFIFGTDDRTVAFGFRPDKLWTINGPEGGGTTRYMNPICDLVSTNQGSGKDWILSAEGDGFWLRVQGNNQWDPGMITGNDYSFFVDWSTTYGANTDDTRLYNSNTLVPSLGGNTVAINTATDGTTMFGGAAQNDSDIGFTGRIYSFFMQRAIMTASERATVDSFMRAAAGL